MKPWEIPDQATQKGAAKPWEMPASAAEEYAALPWYAQAAQAADDTVRFLANGMTLGYADKIAGYLGGEGTEAERAKTAAAKERAGSAGTAAEILGTLAPVTALSRSALSATRLVPAGLDGMKGLTARSLAAGADAGTLGAIQATGNDTDPVTGALLGAAGGTLGNVAGEGITAGASKVLGALNRPPQIMSADELKAAGSRAFQEADNAGVVFRPEAVDRLRQTVYDDFADFGFHPKNQPGAGVVYDELARLAEGGNVSLKGLDSARKIAQGGFNPTNPSNNALLSKAIERIDDFAASAGPGDVLTGDTQAASAALRQGRDMWSRFRKLEKVDELLNRAEMNAASSGTGGNVQNATKQQLKRILMDKKQMRGFTPDEREALRKAVMGTPSERILRMLGSFDPSKGAIPAAFGGAISFSNPAIGIPMMVGGAAARRGAEAITGRNAEVVKKLIAAGGKKSALEGPKNSLQRLAESQREALVRALMAGSLVAAGQQ